MQTKQYKLNNATMRNTFILILLTLLSIIANNLAAQTTEPTKVTVFERSKDNTDYRIPSIVKLANGNLMAFCDNRYNHGDTDLGGGVCDIVSKISTDNGSTWGERRTVLKGTATNKDYYAYGDPATVVDRETGEILLLCVAGAEGVNAANNNVQFIRTVSKDNGSTWESSNVSTAIRGACPELNYGGFFTSGHIYQSSKIKEGAYYRIYVVIPSYSTTSSGNYIGALVVYSDDFGVTWNRLGGKVYPAEKGSECKIEELPNGNVILSCRGLGGTNAPEEGRYYNLFSYSNYTTGSGNWDKLQQSNFEGNGDGQVKGRRSDGDIILVPAKDKKGNKVHILLQSADYPNRKGQWINYKVLSSEADYDSSSDFVNGWSYYEVYNGNSAYSAMILDQNNDVAFLYEGGNRTDGDVHGYDIVFVSLPLETITGGAYTFDIERKDESLASPYFPVKQGEYSNEISVEITCATNGATIYYTTDGSEPTTASYKYTGAISISETTMLKAIAVKGGLQSEVATATYTIIEKTEEMEANVKPEDGGVYVFYAKLSSGNPLYVYNNNGTLSINSVSNEANVTVSENYLWVCQKESDGSYYFSSLDGTGYLGLNNNNASFVTDFSDALKMNITEESVTISTNSRPPSRPNNTTTIKGYVLKYSIPDDNNIRYVYVNTDGTFDRHQQAACSNSNTTLFVFNKVPYVKGGTGCGTLSEPMHHGFNVKFARNDDSYNVAGTGEGYNSYATLNLPFTVSLPDGVKAYRIKSLSKKVNTAVDIEEYAGTVIARETAVLLQTSGAKGDGMTTKTISFKPTTAKENTEDTGLAGTLGRQVFANYNESTGDSNGTIYYLLGKKDGHVAFYYLAANKSGEMAIANNKAYYKYTVGSGAKPAMLTFNLGGTPTAIKGVTDNGCGQSGTWYDLTGRKVKNPSHGIYIRNGKKVVLP